MQVFATLKDHFEKEFELHTDVQSTEKLKEVLIDMHPAAAGILSSCRFAVNDDFVDKDFKLQSHDTIAIIPPSSGG